MHAFPIGEAPILRGKRILLGVTGSIAAYKAADLASKLNQLEAEVVVILTRSAQQFISPLTFQSVTGRKAYVEDDLWGDQAHVLHVGLAHDADLLVIAPATAHLLAQLAAGAADSLLTLTALAAQCPLVLAPAMDAGMYEHPAVRANVELLRHRGATIAGPREGRMASGLQGVGRMVEPQELIGYMRLALGADGPLRRRRVVVTAGGTQEPVDPVRMVTNRSSGKQGFALAQAALDRGAKVTLITGPSQLATPAGAMRVEVETAAQMHAAVLEAAATADVLLMAAAVADFRPSAAAQHKLKKRDGLPTIEFEPTEDILASVAKARRATGSPAVVVGFAAESQDLVENAREKLQRKGLDLIAANDISATDAGFAVDTNRVTLIDSEDAVQALPLLSKSEVAEVVLDRVERMLK